MIGIRSSHRHAHRESDRVRFIESLARTAPNVIDDLDARVVRDLRQELAIGLAHADLPPLVPLRFPTEDCSARDALRRIEEERRSYVDELADALTVAAFGGRRAAMLRAVDDIWRELLPPGTWAQMVFAVQRDPESRWRTVCADLEGWAARWRLREEWCLDFALATCVLWAINERAREARDIYVPRRIGASSDERAFAISWWTAASGVSFEHFRATARTQLLEQLDAALAELAAEIERERIAAAPLRSDEESFDWTVRYVVLGETYESIAGARRTAAAVKKRVGRVSEQIELRMPSRRGRPSAIRTPPRQSQRLV